MPFGENIQTTRTYSLVDHVGGLALGAAGYAALGFVAWLGGSFIDAISAYFWGSASIFLYRPWLSILVVFIMVVTAFALGALKKSTGQLWYGLSEILIGAVWTVQALPYSKPDVAALQGARLAQFFASVVYLLRRGVYNVLDGFPKWTAVRLSERKTGTAI
jgi:hypothetical protein